LICIKKSGSICVHATAGIFWTGHRAFESACPIQQWRKTYPGSYEDLLARFCASKGETKRIKDFIQVLLLHKKSDKFNFEFAICPVLSYYKLKSKLRALDELY